MSMRIAEIPKWVLCATVLGAPLYLVRFHVGVVPTNILEVLVGLCTLVWCTGHIYNRTCPRVPSWWKPAALIVIGGVVSALAAPPELWLKSFGILKGFILEPMLVGWIASDVVKGRQMISDKWQMTHWLLVSIMLSAAAVALLSLTAYLGFARDAFITWDGRLGGIFLSPNHFAMTLGPVAVLALGLTFFLHNKKLRLFAALALISLVPALWLTQSFGGIVSAVMAMLIACTISFLHTFPQRRFFVLALITVALITIAVSTTFLLSKDLSNPRSSFASRVTVWRVSGEILKDHWLFGIGPGNFQKHYLAQQKKFPPYLEWAVPQPHNLFLAFWLQTGSFGFAGFLWLLVLSVKKALLATTRLSSDPLAPTALIALTAIIAIVLHGLADTTYWKNDLALIFFVLLAMW